MTRRKWIVSSLLVMATTMWLSGCGSSSSVPPPQASQPKHDDHGAHADTAEIAETLAKLAPADKAAAEKQKICPVTGVPLGSMGVPPKVSVNGRDVFLCCERCEDALKEDPEKHLAKLPK